MFDGVTSITWPVYKSRRRKGKKMNSLSFLEKKYYGSVLTGHLSPCILTGGGDRKDLRQEGTAAAWR